MRNVTYSAVCMSNLIGSAANPFILQIVSPSREIFIKSITFTNSIFSTGMSMYLPEEENRDIQTILVIDAITAGEQISRAFTIPVGMGSDIPAFNGNSIMIFKTGHFHFNGFSVSNGLTFNLNHGNSNAGESYNVISSIVVETEENIIY